MLSNPRFLFLLLTIPSFLLIPIIWDIIANIVELRHLERPDYDWPKLSDFYVTVLWIALIAILKKFSAWLAFDFFYRRLPAKFEGDARIEKTTKITDNLFKTIYFGAMQVYGFIFVMMEFPFHPPSLGGSK